MLSRIFWVGLAGIAMLTGMVLQDGRWMSGWGDRHVDVSIDRTADRAVDRAVDRSIDHLQAVGPAGRQIAMSPETKRAMAEALSRLVKAEADHAVLRVGDASEEEMQAAHVRRVRARAEVERLKAEIDRQDQAPDRDAVSEEIGREIREDIRATVRDAVRN